MSFSPLAAAWPGRSVSVDEGDVGQRGGAAHRVAAEGREVVADLEGVGDLGARGEGAQRPAVGDALGHGDDVGLDAVVLDGEQLAGAPEAALHLVGDEERCPPSSRICLTRLEVAGRRHDDAALAHHRLGDEGAARCPTGAGA